VGFGGVGGFKNPGIIPSGGGEYPRQHTPPQWGGTGKKRLYRPQGHGVPKQVKKVRGKKSPPSEKLRVAARTTNERKKTIKG